MIKQILIIVLITTLSSTQGEAQQQKRVSTHLRTQTLQNNKVITAEADLYLEFPSGQILMYNYFPEEFVFISNPLGEARLYQPKQKKMTIKANEALTSRNNNLYYFLINKTYDLGYKDLGFKITGSSTDNEAFITTWQAPLHLLKQVDKIKLIHENLLPIYARYINTKGETVLKVYFEDFVQVYDSQVPALITEIVFLPTGDSIIKRMQYSNYRFGKECDSAKFNIEIPDDVQIIK